MFKCLGRFISGLLGTDKAANLAIDMIRDKAGLNEMTGKEQAQFVLDYMATTKHQSPVRRLLAVTVLFVWALFILGWGVLCVVGNMLDVQGAITTASLFFTMIKEVSPYFAGCMAFYFGAGIVNSAKSK